MNISRPILVLGGGEIGSAVAVYLHQAHLPVALVLYEAEIYLRRPICLGEAGVSGHKRYRTTTAVLIDEKQLFAQENGDHAKRWHKAIWFQIKNRNIPVFYEGDLERYTDILQPLIIINSSDAYFKNILPSMADLVIGLCPDHKIGESCHLSIERRFNYKLGMSYTSDPEPGPEFDYHFYKSVLEAVHSPIAGIFVSSKDIGEDVGQGESLGTVNKIHIRSPFKGQIWGILHSGIYIESRQPLALIYDGHSENAYKYFQFYHRVIAGSILLEVLKQLGFSTTGR